MVTEEMPRGWTHFLKMRRVLVINLLLFVAVAWAFASEYTANRDMAQQVQAKAAAADQLNQEYLATAEKAKTLTGTDALEREARLKFNLMRPGEEVVVLQGVAENQEDWPPSTPSSSPAVAAAPTSNWIGWWHYFFK